MSAWGSAGLSPRGLRGELASRVGGSMWALRLREEGVGLSRPQVPQARSPGRSPHSGGSAPRRVCPRPPPAAPWCRGTGAAWASGPVTPTSSPRGKGSWAPAPWGLRPLPTWERTRSDADGGREGGKSGPPFVPPPAFWCLPAPSPQTAPQNHPGSSRKPEASPHRRPMASAGRFKPSGVTQCGGESRGGVRLVPVNAVSPHPLPPPRGQGTCLSPNSPQVSRPGAQAPPKLPLPSAPGHPAPVRPDRAPRWIKALSQPWPLGCPAPPWGALSLTCWGRPRYPQRGAARAAAAAAPGSERTRRGGR